MENKARKEESIFELRPKKSKNVFVRIWRSWTFRILAIIILGIPLLLAVGFLSVRLGCKVTLPPASQKTSLTASSTPEIKAVKDSLKNYYRDEESSYLTFPEWYIVYSAHEYANTLKNSKPSSFPYFRSTAQFWCSYNSVYESTQRDYGFNRGRHFMISVIGVSFTAENIIKGIYENTIGRVTELISGLSEEDEFAYKVANEYANYLHHTPWYEFPFYSKIDNLWQDTGLVSLRIFRKIERKAILTVEYGVKEIYARLIKKGTRATYEPAPLTIMLEVEPLSTAVLAKDSRIKVIETLASSSQIIEIPRYEEFTKIMLMLARENVAIKDIAGNDEILITVLSKTNNTINIENAAEVFSMNILTEPGTKRVALIVPVTELSKTLVALESQEIKIEHLYDY